MAISMKFIENLRGATEDNYLDVLDPLLNPDSDEVEAGKAYTELLGYNPITFHTDEAISKVIKALETSIPELSSTLHEIEQSLRDAIHEEVRALKKETVADIVFDSLLNYSNDIGISIQEVKEIIESTLDLPDLIIDSLDSDDDYDITSYEDEDEEETFDNEFDDLDFDDEDEDDYE